MQASKDNIKFQVHSKLFLLLATTAYFLLKIDVWKFWSVKVYAVNIKSTIIHFICINTESLL